LRDIDGLRHLDGDTQIRVLNRYDKVEDPDAFARFVNDLDGSRINRLLELEPKETDRLSNLYSHKARTEGCIDVQDGRKLLYRHIDEELSASDLLRVTDSNGDISKTIMVLQTAKGTKWLKVGNPYAGFRHILNRHKNDFISNSRLNVNSAEDIKDLIYTVVKKGDAQRIPEADEGGWAYVYEVNGKSVTVITGSNGYIVTAYPGTPDL
jgi:hypothetical protein